MPTRRPSACGRPRLRQRFRRAAPVLAALLVASAFAAARLRRTAADTPPPAAADASSTPSYQRDVLPLLRRNCHGCHQPARASGGVDLTTPAGMRAVGESGAAAVVPGDADASELIRQITPDAAGAAAMPKDSRSLEPAEIALVRRWIAAGAPVDGGDAPPRFDPTHPPAYAAAPAVAALDASPDGRLLAVAGTHEAVLVDAAAARRGQRVVAFRLIGLAERLEALRFSPDGARLAVAGGLPGEMGELQIWDVAAGALLVSQPIGADVLQSVAWSPDGAKVACGAPDTKLYVCDSQSGAPLIEQGAHADWVLDAAFSVDGTLLVSGSRDQTLKLAEAATGRFVDNITAVSPNVPSGQVFAVARHPTRNLVAIGGSEGVPRTYMLQRVVERKIGDDSNLVRLYPAVPGRIFSLGFSPDGARLAVASSDGRAGRVDLFAVPDALAPPDDVKLIQGKEVDQRTATERARLDAHHRAGAVRLAAASAPLPPQYAVAFLPDGRHVASAGADGRVRFFDATHGVLVAEFNPFPVEPSAEPATPGPAAQAAAAPPSAAARVEFLTDVMPLLGKLGCNAGACHGARVGQNGFALSLRGYDPLADYRALTDDLAGRRVNRVDPQSSLMLRKPLGLVPHGGGAVLAGDARRSEILRRWIAQGATYNPAAPRVVSISLEPQNPVLDVPGQSLAMRVTAEYSDGTVRDVTADAFVESADAECATADAAGRVTAVRRGEAPVLARYEGAYAATTLTVMGDRAGFQWIQAPTYSPLDELVDSKLRRMRIAVSPLASDEEFLRRASFDLTGLPPTADQVRAFLADPRDARTKREALIDELIGCEDYVEHWTNRWADLLLVNGKFLGPEGAAAYRAWIRTAVAENRPYDQLVRELFAAVGSNRDQPAASFFKVLRTPEAIAETTSQAFLGVRFNCNKCHDHPFERWTQDDYYQWAAYFADVRLAKDEASGERTVGGTAVDAAQPLYEIVTDGTGGQVAHLRTGQPAAPRFPYPAGDRPAASAALRHQAAAWLTSPENRYFASSYVNRVWAHLFGAGLIEPVDDIRAGNPPSNPELLRWLTREFVASGFDSQALLRTICRSRTYQLSAKTNRWNVDDRRNYSHALPRRLPAEALFDAVHRAVGAVSHLPGLPAGARAAALPDSMVELDDGLLATLGRPARESGCQCERSDDLQLGPVMALVNGPTLAAAIADPASELAQLEAATPDDGALATEVFLRVLGRQPTAAERIAAQASLAAGGDERQQADEALASRREALLKDFASWRRAHRPVDWKRLDPTQAATTTATKLEAQGDGVVISTGGTGRGAYRVEFSAPAMPLRGLRLEALADDSLPSRGPGRAPNGNFVLSEVRIWLRRAGADPTAPLRRLKIRTAEADFAQPGYPVVSAIDGSTATGWAVGGAQGADHTAAFALSRPINISAGDALIVELDHQFDDDHLLGRFRIAVTAAAAPLLPQDFGDAVRPLLAAEYDQLTPGEQAKLREAYLTLDAEFVRLSRGRELLANPRLVAVQDLAWALINTPAFLFNH